MTKIFKLIILKQQLELIIPSSNLLSEDKYPVSILIMSIQY